MIHQSPNLSLDLHAITSDEVMQIPAKKRYLRHQSILTRLVPEFITTLSFCS